MYKRILMAYDGSETGQRALLDCREIADWSQSQIVLVAVMPPAVALVGGEGGIYDARSEEEDRKQYQGILDEGLRHLAEAGHTATGEVVVGDAVDEIAKCARRINADLIVVGHKHLDNWAKRWWSGSVSKSLIELSPCSVLVVITR